ncbi:MAG: hypothetical protein MUF54_21785 [Polyangiaceae bacterium]|jgi:hypothetical protein|nr:hypothetical protein [Polyangiaceae bacterium]
MHRNIAALPVAVLLTALAIGCKDKAGTDLAPVASALTPAAQASKKSDKLVVNTSTGQVGFLMDAPLEKIHGKAPGALEGELFVDLDDVTKSSGLVKVDLFKLDLVQQKRGSEGEDFGKETKSDTQNEHARAWLEIGDDAPPDKRAEYRYVELKVTTIEAKGEKNINKMSGAERKVMLTVTGDFRLHGRVMKKSADMEAVFLFDGDKLTSVQFRNMGPFKVGLAEHDVRPRTGFGVLAQKTLEAVAPSVAKEAAVSLEFEATPAK